MGKWGDSQMTATPATPRVTAIVVGYNGAEDLCRALKALLASVDVSLDVVVVDNCSEDRTPEVAESFPVQLVRNPRNLGFAEANNIGLRLATGDYIALVNQDAVVEQEWARELVRFLDAHPEAAAAGGKQYIWDHERAPGDRAGPYFGACRLSRDAQTPSQLNGPDEIREVVTLSGCAVMIRRAAIDDAGEPFLDPLFFMYYEETDFFTRVLRKGWKLHYVWHAVCWHRVSNRQARYHYFMSRNRILLAYRHFDDENLRSILRYTRRQVWFPRLRSPWAALAGIARHRALRRAWRWLLDNQDLLQEHRARHFKPGYSYHQMVREIEARAAYYGHARPEVAALVPLGARNVVDIGCGRGGLGRTLRACRPEAKVYGIEPVAEQAELARAVYDDVHIGTAESGLPPRWPRPDAVVFADVLEHLSDPWGVLRQWREILAPEGHIVISLPNVAHHEVLVGLRRGRWDYQDEGVLDRTHVRFFTRATACSMVVEAGLHIDAIARTYQLPRSKLWRLLLRVATLPRRRFERKRGVPHSGHRNLTDACTLQYLIVARKAGSGDTASDQATEGGSDSRQ